MMLPCDVGLGLESGSLWGYAQKKEFLDWGHDAEGSGSGGLSLGNVLTGQYYKGKGSGMGAL